MANHAEAQHTDHHNDSTQPPKRALGRTPIHATEVITHARVALDEVARTSIEDRLRLTLMPFGTRISRALIRLRDENGPRGGPGLRCSIEVVFDGGDRVRIEQRASEVLEAVRRVMPRVARAVRHHVERSGQKTPRATLRPQFAALEPEAPLTNGHNGNHHGKHDGSQNDSGMTYALEDCAGRPSRKSTRASSNHIKAASQLTRRVRRALQSPQARAAKSAA
jgi:ribosome-associated translation inhibitor RaiA